MCDNIAWAQIKLKNEVSGPVFKTAFLGTFLAVQRLRLCASNAGGAGSISGWGTKIPHAHGDKKGDGGVIIPNSGV